MLGDNEMKRRFHRAVAHFDGSASIPHGRIAHVFASCTAFDLLPQNDVKDARQWRDVADFEISSTPRWA